jgi:prolyl 4-hydroxylase
MTDWRQRLTRSPELFPLTLDAATDRLGFVQLAPVDYERASFLDGRLEQPIVAVRSCEETLADVAELPVACDFIFHVGHVGSTLLSRLLGTHPQIFSVREPQPLRTLAQAEVAGRPWAAQAFDARLALILKLGSRSWSPAKRSLIKATSLVSELGVRMAAAAPQARIVAMTAAPETYIATILGGPNSRVELQTAAADRLARLTRRLGPIENLASLSEGEVAAMSWASEMAALRAIDAAALGRVLWIDFDRFLADPRTGLAQVLNHLHGRADAAIVEQIAASPYFQRYSKAPEYGYGADVRREVLEGARREHADEIRRGLAWLDAHPAVKGPAGAAVSSPFAEIHARAAGGDAEAIAFTAVLAGLGAGEPQDWSVALARLVSAAQAGSTAAHGQLEVLAERTGGGAAALAERIDLTAWTQGAQRTRLSDDPRIAVGPAFLPSAVCRWLIARAAGRLSAAQVFDQGSGVARGDRERSNTAFSFAFEDLDLVCVAVRARIAATIGMPAGALEPMQVLHYDPGQSFARHFDFLDPAVPAFAEDVARSGQRIVTFLTYLNDDYAGGETDFPQLGISHRGKAGEALIFANIDASGAPDRRTLHAGLPPHSGEKWLLSQWVRDRVTS